MEEKYKILVVEDDKIQANMLKRILVHAGYDVIIVDNGKDVISLIPKLKPSIVISDILMPIMDGYEMCRQIKLDENIQDTPVILLTELQSTSDIIKGIEAKADGYITKPFDKEHLLNKIKHILSITPHKHKTEPQTIVFNNEIHTVPLNYQQMFDLLLDTYENIIIQNKELTRRTEELQKSKDELQKSEDRFRSLVQSVPDVIYKIDTEGRFTFFNNSIRKLGYEPEELIGKHFSEFIFKEDIDSICRDKVLPKLTGKNIGEKDAPKLFDERRKHGRHTVNLEVRIIAKESEDFRHGLLESIGSDIVFTEVDSFGLYENEDDIDGKYIGTVGIIKKKEMQFIGTTGVIRDITERKKIEENLLTDKFFLENILQNITNGIYVLDPQGIIVMVNKVGANIFKYTSDNLVGCRFSNILTSAEFEGNFSKILKTGSRIVGLNEMIINKEGLIRFLKICLTPLSIDNRITNVVAVIEDITEHKKIEEERITNEEKFRGITERNFDVIVLMDRNGFITYASSAVQKITGFTPEEFIGKHFKEFIAEQDLSYVYSAFSNLLKGESLEGLEVKALKKDGSVIYIEANAFPIIKDNEIIGIQAIYRDIDKRKKVEFALKESEKKLQSIIDNSTTVVFLKDLEGKYLLINHQYEELFHITKNDIIGKTDYYIFPKDLADVFRANDLKVRENGSPMTFEENVSQDDGIHTYISVKFPLFDENGAIYAICGISTDITERKKMEEELNMINNNLASLVNEETKRRQTSEQILIQQSKMASMGEMIGLIAHQWKQPLNAVSLIVQDIKDAYSFGELDEKYVTSSVNNTMQQIFFMSKTIDDFRNFFIPSKKKIIFDVKSSIEELYSMFENVFTKSNIEVLIKADQARVLSTNGYPNEFKQVILNILNNAKDAIISRKQSEPEIQGLIDINIGNTEDNGKIIILIKDNGGGIPEGIIEKIFEPYYTTKESTGGTGVGLYMSRTIIETNIGGTLTVRNVDKGAEFLITLKPEIE